MTRAAEQQVVVVDYRNLVSLSGNGQGTPEVDTILAQQIEQVKRQVGRSWPCLGEVSP